MTPEAMEEIVAEVVDHIAFIRLPGYGADEVRFLTETVCAAQPDYIFEWGTNRGSSARIFYTATLFACPTCRIYTIELPFSYGSYTADHPGKFVGIFIRGYPRVKRREGDGVDVALRLNKSLRPRPKRPLFFVDGDHSEEAVESELSQIIAAAPEAVIVLHDTNHPAINGPTGPALAVRRLAEETDAYQVDELMSQAGMIRLTPK